MRADVTLLFQLQESRVKRAVIQGKKVCADLLNVPSQPVLMAESRWSGEYTRP